MTDPISAATAMDWQVLTPLFYASGDALGQFQEVQASDLPSTPRLLLAHDGHMTEAMEQFHAGPVTVEVLATHQDGNHYARKILLRRQSDGFPVQYGIMRVDLSRLSPVVQQEIVSQKKPLGRVLIDHDVMRRVQLHRLWKIWPASELQALLKTAGPVYGRTAMIECEREPAVELLEIVN